MADPVLETFTCPWCKKPVRTFWDGDQGGMLSDYESTLIGDCVFHSKCWDALVEKHPPGAQPKDEDDLIMVGDLDTSPWAPSGLRAMAYWLLIIGGLTWLDWFLDWISS
jgi:hypothetical protein